MNKLEVESFVNKLNDMYNNDEDWNKIYSLIIEADSSDGCGCDYFRKDNLISKYEQYKKLGDFAMLLLNNDLKIEKLFAEMLDSIYYELIIDAEEEQDINLTGEDEEIFYDFAI